MSLPTQYQEYYVYAHIDPDTQECVYIGHGKGPRAWHYGTYRGTTENKSYGARKESHSRWCEKRIEKGYLPNDWVIILDKNLSKADACSFEQELIREKNPVYNSPLGEKLLKMNMEDIEIAKEMREAGYSYNSISNELEIPTMTIWRTLNGKNKNQL